MKRFDLKDLKEAARAEPADEFDPLDYADVVARLARVFPIDGRYRFVLAVDEADAAGALHMYIGGFPPQSVATLRESLQEAIEAALTAAAEPETVQ